MDVRCRIREVVKLDLMLEHACDDILNESLELRFLHGGRKTVFVCKDLFEEVGRVLQTDKKDVIDPD